MCARMRDNKYRMILRLLVAAIFSGLVAIAMIALAFSFARDVNRLQDNVASLHDNVASVESINNVLESELDREKAINKRLEVNLHRSGIAGVIPAIQQLEKVRSELTKACKESTDVDLAHSIVTLKGHLHEGDFIALQVWGARNPGAQQLRVDEWVEDYWIENDACYSKNVLTLVPENIELEAWNYYLPMSNSLIPGQIGNGYGSVVIGAHSPVDLNSVLQKMIDYDTIYFARIIIKKEDLDDDGRVVVEINQGSYQKDLDYSFSSPSATSVPGEVGYISRLHFGQKLSHVWGGQFDPVAGAVSFRGAADPRPVRPYKGLSVSEDWYDIEGNRTPDVQHYVYEVKRTATIEYPVLGFLQDHK